MGLPRTVMGIPVYLVSLDPWDSMPGDPGCPGYPRTLRDLILGCIMYLGMSRVVLGQAVAVFNSQSILYANTSIQHNTRVLFSINRIPQGCALWSLNCSEMKHLDVCLNRCLPHTWSFPLIAILVLFIVFLVV